MQKFPTEDQSVCQNFTKDYPDPPKIILKWFYRLKLVGLKKKSKKKDPFWGNLCEKVSSCIDNVYVLHIMPPGAPPSTAVDNGGDRSCQFLGLCPYIQILWCNFGWWALFLCDWGNEILFATVIVNHLISLNRNVIIISDEIITAK